MLLYGRLKTKQWLVHLSYYNPDVMEYNLLQINEISSYVIAISEDEIKGNTVTALHTATYDLLPEVGHLNCKTITIIPSLTVHDRSYDALLQFRLQYCSTTLYMQNFT